MTHNLADADILLLSLYRDESENIHEFDELLEQAAKKDGLVTICSNPDTTIPKHGSLRYCSGYFAKIIEKFGGKVIYTGKPEKSIYDLVLNPRQNIQKDRILMIGDTFETDVAGANNAGIHSALVLSGNAERFHVIHKSLEDKLSALHERAKEVGQMPTFVTKTAFK